MFPGRRSGTLTPLPAFAAELQLENPISLENPHVIDADAQLYACVIGTGPGGASLRSTYARRSTDAYLRRSL